MRRTLAVLAVTMLMVAIMPSALAAPAETVTVHYDMTDIVDPFNPCEGLIGVGSINAVFHETLNGNGGHFTNTETGSAVGVGPLGEVVVVDHYAFWVGGNFNAKTGIFHLVVTLNVKGTADGEPFMFNLRDNFKDDGEFVNGTFTFNCHDGSGPQSFDYSFPSGP